mmetsp:Transcript_5706/g.13223  ORF Transcript_5706/g.13223 Transcript_5706/m.13223 type:complete len:250 (-) Transcript_5706:385-1134(-)
MLCQPRRRHVLVALLCRHVPDAARARKCSVELRLSLGSRAVVNRRRPCVSKCIEVELFGLGLLAQLLRLLLLAPRLLEFDRLRWQVVGACRHDRRRCACGEIILLRGAAPTLLREQLLLDCSQLLELRLVHAAARVEAHSGTRFLLVILVQQRVLIARQCPRASRHSTCLISALVLCQVDVFEHLLIIVQLMRVAILDDNGFVCKSEDDALSLFEIINTMAHQSATDMLGLIFRFVHLERGHHDCRATL